jgi:hypothetical protein
MALSGCGDERDPAVSAPPRGTALPNPSAPPTSVATSSAANGTPAITVTAQHSVLVGRELIVRPLAADPEGKALSFSVSNKPAWMTFSSTTGQLQGTPSAAHVATYENIRVTASDGQAQASATTSISVLASAAGRATLSWSAPAQRTDGSALTNLAGFRIYYGNSADDLRFVIEVKDPGARSWVVEDLTAGTWYFAATAFDSVNAESARSGVASKSIA